MLDDLAKHRVERTWITETLTMASAGETGPPMLVSIKAVDPKVYPFYGEIRLSSAAPLRTVLTDDSIAVSDDILLRLNLKIGDTLQLGGKQFRIVGQVTYRAGSNARKPERRPARDDDAERTGPYRADAAGQSRGRAVHVSDWIRDRRTSKKSGNS